MRIPASLPRNPDIVLALVVVGILGALLVPLPPAVLDLLLVANVALALTMLVAALHAERPLALSGFPSLLLIATLFRLALNVSSTRLILGTGSAGSVIEAFGAFVVQGSYLVGAVVFLIVTLIQFLVVAKGAERVAEVGARFTLDALPGKQLSIDADIRAGACTQSEGKARRLELERESQLYGALDGAMKFVKGDAIAGLVITAVNVVGGLAAGTLNHGLSITESLATFTLLSIGDGLLAQIPALLTAVSAGVVVTRVAGGTGSLAGDLARQLGAQPQAFGVVAGVLGVLALVPGLPFLPFAVLGTLAGATAVLLARRPPAPAEPAPETAPESPDGQGDAPSPLVLALGSEVPEALATALVAALPELRARLGRDLGLPVPGVRVRFGGVPGKGFEVLVNEVPVSSGEVPEGPLVTVEAQEAGLLGLSGRPGLHLGRAAFLLEPASVAGAGEAGLRVTAPWEAVTETLAQAIRRRAAELLTVQITQVLLDTLEVRAPTTVREVASRIPVPVLSEILRRLLDEGISLRWLERILEALAASRESVETVGVAGLVERARGGLGRQLVHAHSTGGVLPVLVLDPLTEDLLRESLTETSDGPVVALDPGHQSALQDALARELTEPGVVVLASRELRRYLWRLVGTVREDAAVLAYQELPSDVRLRPLARIGIEGLDPVALGM